MKTAAILNNAVAPVFKGELISKMQSGPYSILIDGLNDMGLDKLNPITVRIFDIDRRRTFP